MDIVLLILLLLLCSMGWLLWHIMSQQGRLLLRIEATEAQLAKGGLTLFEEQVESSVTGLAVGTQAPELPAGLKIGDVAPNRLPVPGSASWLRTSVCPILLATWSTSPISEAARHWYSSGVPVAAFARTCSRSCWCGRHRNRREPPPSWSSRPAAWRTIRRWACVRPLCSTRQTGASEACLGPPARPLRSWSMPRAGSPPNSRKGHQPLSSWQGCRQGKPRGGSN